jgi:hypothetical protein
MPESCRRNHHTWKPAVLKIGRRANIKLKLMDVIVEYRDIACKASGSVSDSTDQTGETIMILT